MKRVKEKERKSEQARKSKQGKKEIEEIERMNWNGKTENSMPSVFRNIFQLGDRETGENQEF